MKDKLEAIKAEALAKIESAEVVSSLNDVKVAILGKKGELTQVLKSMKKDLRQWTVRTSPKPML